MRVRLRVLGFRVYGWNSKFGVRVEGYSPCSPGGLPTQNMLEIEYVLL